MTSTSTPTSNTASSTAEMWSQAAAAYQAYNNSAQWSNAAQMYNTASAYGNNQWDANSAYNTNWSTGAANTGTAGTGTTGYNTNQWYGGNYNTGTGDASSYSTGMTGASNNQNAYTANTAAFSTNTGYVDQSQNYGADGYSTGGYGNQYGNYGGYGNQGYGNKGNDKGGRFGNNRSGSGNRNQGSMGGGNRSGGGRSGGMGGGGRDRDRSNGRSGGRDGRMGGGRFSDGGSGGRFGGRRDRDESGDFDKPYNPKRVKLDRDMGRMSGMIEQTSSTISSLRRGWGNMDSKELNKKVDYLLNQQMMLIEKQSHMAEMMERREMEMMSEMNAMMKDRDDMMRHMGPGGYGGGFEGGMPGPRWSRDMRDNSWISPEESVMRFTEYLLFFFPKPTCTQTLIRAVLSSRLNIKVEFRFKELEKDGDKVIRGHLLLGYFVLSHGTNSDLDTLRDFLFERAMYTLMTKTLGHIAVNSNRVMEAKKNEDRIIRGDEMCEINGSEAVKIWSSRPDRDRDHKDKDKDEKKEDKSEDSEVKTEETAETEKHEDEEMKEESEQQQQQQQQQLQEGEEHSEKDGEEKHDDTKSEDGKRGRERRDSERSKDDRRDRSREDRHDRDRHGRQRKPRSEYKFFSPRLRERLEMMRDELPTGQHIRSIHDMSYAAKCNNVGITLTVYRRRPDDFLLETYDAELYADEIYLGRGHGKDVREAHKYAFIHSRDEILAASLNEMLATRKRLIELNLNDPLLLDVQYRGPFHDVGNNMSNLKMANEWPLGEDKPIDDFILLEDEEDRKKNHYKTLEVSATQNSMLLEWVRSGREDNMPHRCQLYLEKVKIADVKAPNKIKAKNMAAQAALKKLKTTQTFIRYSIDPEKPPLFTHTDLKERSQILENRYKQIKAEETGIIEEDEEPKTEEEEKEESREERRERREKERIKEREKEELEERCLDEVIGEEVDKYLAQDDMEGVTLGEDLPVNIKRRVSLLAVQKGLLVMPCGTDDLILLNKDNYLCPNMVKKLTENDNKLGRYYLVQLRVAGEEKPMRLVEEEEEDDEEDEESKDHSKDERDEEKPAEKSEEVKTEDIKTEPDSENGNTETAMEAE
ncbi:hypothetical protein LOTGIDRAFT_229969 [Lottia gigantea]|uniref:DRBM domain-containing protein n=1 Tax=Lottia gigantea TaxID=225164 RepID=V4AL30_LOTGI|nr:hypothetical protein LOTGIDRAFT_229969 [Lottia gigantea]ESP04884.1 hypothetical protein LOTGIDRAFT_229969 [Lottia gigantea]